MPVIYLRNRRRTPVWVGARPPLQDTGGEIPYGWCSKCGMECFLPGKALCRQCEEKEKNICQNDSDTPAEDVQECPIPSSAKTSAAICGKNGFCTSGSSPENAF